MLIRSRINMGFCGLAHLRCARMERGGGRLGDWVAGTRVTWRAMSVLFGVAEWNCVPGGYALLGVIQHLRCCFWRWVLLPHANCEAISVGFRGLAHLRCARMERGGGRLGDWVAGTRVTWHAMSVLFEVGIFVALRVTVGGLWGVPVGGVNVRPGAMSPSGGIVPG